MNYLVNCFFVLSTVLQISLPARRVAVINVPIIHKLIGTSRCAVRPSIRDRIEVANLLFFNFSKCQSDNLFMPRQYKSKSNTRTAHIMKIYIRTVARE